MLRNKKIILGITGGIAAYKCAELTRLLIKQGAEVQVLMTHDAESFVTPQTLTVLSKKPVIRDFFNELGQWNNHVHLAEWADLILIAPLTANTLAKMVTGACDNALLATYMSGWSKSMVAPAMDRDMIKHPGVLKNLEQLTSYGTIVIPASNGELASGLHGEGRMAEPENIVDAVLLYFHNNLPLDGKKALVNAGPTHEAIDPVRFIGNRSSGKMGLAIASALASRGAEVTLVTGPIALEIKNKAIKVVKVHSSDEMFQAMMSAVKEQDIIVCAAAVADYKPASVSTKKIKKKGDEMEIKLIKTRDILEAIGVKKQKKQYLVGFALETDNLIEYAKSKLVKKNLDLVVANPASEPGSGMESDHNRAVLINRHNKITKLKLKPKAELAIEIVDYIINAIK